MPVGSQSKGRRVITFKATFSHEPDYLSAGLLFGELVHTLRSVLDNVAYALAVKIGSASDVDRDIAYPICDSEAEYNAWVARRLPNVGAEYLSIIKQSQPFVRSPSNPSQDPLSLLHRSDIWDKHKVPSICGLVSDSFSYSVRTEDFQRLNNNREEIKVVFPPQEPVTPGSVIAKMKFKRPFKPGPKIEVNAQMRFKIHLVGEYYGIKELSESMSQRVFEVVNSVTEQLQRR